MPLLFDTASVAELFGTWKSASSYEAVRIFFVATGKNYSRKTILAKKRSFSKEDPRGA